MSSEPPTKKVKTSTDAAPPAVFGRGVHFTPELIARMATYADANNSPDVMNICLAVGPDVSRTIKHFYLRRNEKYLICTLLSLCGIRRRKQFDVEAPRREKAGTNHRAWMEVNTDWKATAVRNDRISKMRQTGSLVTIYPFDAFNSATIAVELGLLEVVKFLIEDKGVSPNEYGWTFHQGSIYSYRDPPNLYREHLLSVAMTFRQDNIFQYLLSLPSANLYAEIDRCSEGEARYGLFAQALDMYVMCDDANAYLMSLVNHNRFDVNRACHCYSTFPGSNFTCLFIALYELENCFDDIEITTVHEEPDLTKHDSERLNRYKNIIKLLLEAGANPKQAVLTNPNEGILTSQSGISLIVNRLQPGLRRNSRNRSLCLLKERVYRQVIKIMNDTHVP